MQQDSQGIALSLGNWLTSKWPQHTDLEVLNIQPPIQGFSNETWLLDVAWTEAGQRQVRPAVLRLQPADIALFPSYDLSLQYRCMAALAGTDVPVPELMGYCGASEPGNPFGRAFYVMQRMQGRCPTENPPYHTGGWLHDLPAQRQQSLWMSGVEMMARVNRLDWQSLGLDFLDVASSAGSPLDRQLQEGREFLNWAESLAEPYPFLQAALTWLEAHRPRHEPVGLCWGDPKLGNCLFDPDTDQCIGVLDWESAHLGNPVDDLAWWIVLDRSLCEGYGMPRLPTLPSKAETVAHWERHSGLSAQALPYYEVFCAFKFAVIMARIGCLFMARGLVPEGFRMDLHNGGSGVLRLIASEQGLPFAGVGA